MFSFIFAKSLNNYAHIFNCGSKTIYHYFVWKQQFGRDLNSHWKNALCFKVWHAVNWATQQIRKEEATYQIIYMCKWCLSFGTCFSKTFWPLHFMAFISSSIDYSLSIHKGPLHSVFLILKSLLVIIPLSWKVGADLCEFAPILLYFRLSISRISIEVFKHRYLIVNIGIKHLSFPLFAKFVNFLLKSRCWRYLKKSKDRTLFFRILRIFIKLIF